MNAVTKEMEQKTSIRCGHVDIYKDQAIRQHFNRTIAEQLFGHQYAVEMWLPDDRGRLNWSKGCLLLSLP